MDDTVSFSASASASHDDSNHRRFRSLLVHDNDGHDDDDGANIDEEYANSRCSQTVSCNDEEEATKNYCCLRFLHHYYHDYFHHHQHHHHQQQQHNKEEGGDGECSKQQDNVVSEMILNVQEQRQGRRLWVSHFLFLLGSILYVWLAVWDINNEEDWSQQQQQQQQQQHLDKENDEENGSVWQQLRDTIFTPYILVSATAAMCYVLDCACHVSTLLLPTSSSTFTSSYSSDLNNKITRTRSHPSYYDGDNEQDIISTTIEVEGLYDIRPSNRTTRHNNHVPKHHHPHHHLELPSTASLGPMSVPVPGPAPSFSFSSFWTYYCCCSASCSSASCSVMMWTKIAITGTFGLGAILDFISALTLDLDNEIVTNRTAIGAAHSYLLHAILVLVLSATTTRLVNTTTTTTTTTATTAMTRTSSGDDGDGGCYCKPTMNLLELLGDILFLVGSIIDVVLSYFYNERTTDHLWILVDRGNLISAILWLIDALLYIAVDFCTSNEDEDDDYEEDNHVDYEDTEEEEEDDDDNDDNFVERNTSSDVDDQTKLLEQRRRRIIMK